MNRRERGRCSCVALLGRRGRARCTGLVTARSPADTEAGRHRVEEFDAMPAGDAVRELLTCCRCGAWAEAVVAGRPYGTLAALSDAAAGLIHDLDWDGILA